MVQRATRGGVEAWLDDAYESADAPFDRDVVNLREALSDLSEVKGAPRMTIQQLAAFLKVKKGADLGPRRLPKLGQKRLWAIRDGERVLRMTPGQIEDIYAERTTISKIDRRSHIQAIAAE